MASFKKNTIFLFKSFKLTTSLRYLSTTSLNTEWTKINFLNGVKYITMCHDKTRNALSLNMMENLIKNIQNDFNNPKLRAIIISGGDGPVFSAGHNLKELTSECGKNQQKKIFKVCSNLMDTLVECPVPVIARINGLAAAAGCQLVAQCDLAFCTEISQFSTPGVNFGIFCSTPGVALVRRIKKSTAIKMLFTGLPINSEQAKQSGLINDVFADYKQMDNEIEKICDAIKLKSRFIIEYGKRFFYKQIELDRKTAYNLGEDVMVENLQFSDGQEGIEAFIEKRKPLWKIKQN